jgi:hypothetical protein
MRHFTTQEFWKAQGFETLGRYFRQDCDSDLREFASNIHKYFDLRSADLTIKMMARGFMSLVRLYDQVENRARHVHQENAELQHTIALLEERLAELGPAPDDAPVLGGKRRKH